MKSTSGQRFRHRAATAMMLLAMTLPAAGCAPRIVPAEGPQISMMATTNPTSSGYDTVPLQWNVGRNTLQSSGTPVLRVDVATGAGGLSWSSGSPLLAVQRWRHEDRMTLIETLSQDLQLLVPPVGMQYASDTGGFFVRWYVPQDGVFVTAPSELYVSSSQSTLDGTVLLLAQHGLASGSKAQTLTVPTPSGVIQMVVLYGSGSIDNGFVVVEAVGADAGQNPQSSLWLLRMNSDGASWVRCGDTSAFGGILFAGQRPSCARVGSLLYVTHGRSGIGCIDVAAPSPSLTFPEKINTLVDRLYLGAPADAVSAVQAQLASDDGTLIVQYPDVDWNNFYYAVGASGTVLGSLRVDKTSVTSFDATGLQGVVLKTPGSTGYLSLPSIDLFESPIT
ncbi:MAG: hypothetical protein Q7V53_02510 [Caldisericota bacterium]|nr:hypothetical protein [Caldisericota bacterium]